jgi:hypothetical protein
MNLPRIYRIAELEESKATLAFNAAAMVAEGRVAAEALLAVEALLAAERARTALLESRLAGL